MKLLNHTLSYLSITFLLVIAIWSVIFYINFLDEIYDSIDDGLENYKMLILERAQVDSSVYQKNEFMESNYAIREIGVKRAQEYRDIYMDTMMYMINEQDYEPVRLLKSAFRANNGKYFELLVMSSMVEEDDLIEDLLNSIIWLYLILLVSIILVNNVILRRIWKPFYSILNRLKNFRIESPLDPVRQKTRVSEFRMLDESVGELLQRTVSVYNGQKQFIENAAHELQTPLAISINRLELLAEKSTTTDEQMQEIGAVIDSLQRLTRLNKTLLLLSKIENKQFPEQSDVNINILTDRLVAEFSDLADFRTVTIEVHHTKTLVRNINEELATILISNLIKNAIIHNKEQGRVKILIADNFISVGNSVTGDALNGAFVFQRFYKEGANKQSTGLGLAIVKSITDYYGYSVHYEFDGEHVFKIIM